MSIRSLSFDTAVKACLPTFNKSVNKLTLNVSQLKTNLYSQIGLSRSYKDRMGDSATFNYDFKVTLYNLASALTIYKATALVLGFSSPVSALAMMGSLLFLRELMNQSMSEEYIPYSSKQGECDHNKLANIYVRASMAWSKANDHDWSADMIKVRRFTIFKNWHVAVPGLSTQTSVPQTVKPNSGRPGPLTMSKS